MWVVGRILSDRRLRVQTPHDACARIRLTTFTSYKPNVLVLCGSLLNRSIRNEVRIGTKETVYDSDLESDEQAEGHANETRSYSKPAMEGREP